MSRRRIALVALMAFAAGVVATPVVHRFKEHTARVSRMAGAPPLDSRVYERRTSQFAVLRSEPRIVFLGDSRLQEGEWAELLGRRDVANRGVAGDTTSGLLARLAGSLPQSAQVCVIQVGYNDALQNNRPEAVEQNVRGIVEALQAKEPAPRVLLTSIILSGDPSGTVNDRLREINTRLQRLAADRGVEWIDLNTVLAPAGVLEPRWTNDRSHLNGRAYEAMAALLKDRLDRLAPASQ